MSVRLNGEAMSLSCEPDNGEREAPTSGVLGSPREDAKESEWEPKVVGFACRWCSYAGADLAGTSRMSYPATLRLVRVPCSGRVNPAFIMRAFQRGADGVLVAGCHPGDCHYTSGNLFARRRLALVQGLIEYLGIEPGRLQIHWISAAEGQKFARVASDMSKTVLTLGRNRKMREEI
jgi:F420-non-reducing hydrogenase iron-sulfur subunit